MKFVVGQLNLSAMMVIAIILSYTVVLHIFVVNGAFYLPMIFLMALTPILLFTKKFWILDLEDILLLLIFLFMFIGAIRHSESFRLSTLLFSGLYFSTFFYYKRLLPVSSLEYSTYSRLLECIIVAYAIVLIIQQLSVALGLPVFNLSYGRFPEESNYKQCALSVEASNSGPILSILAFSLIRIREKVIGKRIPIGYLFKEKRWVTISFIYVCVASISVTCVFSLLLLSIYIIPPKHRLPGIAILALLTLALLFIPSIVGLRIRTLIPVLLSGDAVEIYKVDSSSAARIAPYILFLMDMNLSSPDFWLGHGCDYGSLHVFSEITGMLQNEGMGVGGIINFMYDYGMLAFLLFAAFLCVSCRNNKFAIFLFIMEFFVCPFNHYMIWLFFLIIASTSYFQSQSSLQS